MDNRIFILKYIFVWYIVIAIAIYASTLLWSGKEKFRFGKIKLEKIASIILVSISIYIIFPITADFILFDAKEKVVIVKGIQNPGKVGVIYTYLITSGEPNSYINMYKTFDFVVGNKYIIKYLARTKILIDAKKINDNQP